MTIRTSKNQKVKIESQTCKNRKLKNAEIENLKNQRVLEGGADNLSGLPASSKVASSANKAEQRSIGIKRIRGMMLPRDEIFRLEAAFFEMNSNGNQNNWLAERFRLTKDWKYKSKKKRVS